MKRLYPKAEPVETAAGYGVALEGKMVRTPGKRDLVGLRMVGLVGGSLPQTVSDEAPALRPMCPSCHTALDGNVRLVAIDAGGEAIRLACCATCGAVLPALPGP